MILCCVGVNCCIKYNIWHTYVQKLWDSEVHLVYLQRGVINNIFLYSHKNEIISILFFKALNLIDS